MEEVDLNWKADEEGTQSKVLVGDTLHQGFSAHVADAWFSKGIIKLSLKVEQVSSNEPFAIGLCTGNFTRQLDMGAKSDKESPLATSHHAVCLQSDGRIFVKGAETSWTVPPLEDQSTVVFELSFLKRELTLSIAFGADGDERHVILPFTLNEATLVAMLTNSGQRLRIVACEAAKLDAALSKGKSVPDLWDEENKIEPIDIERKKAATMSSTLTSVAQSCS